MSGEGRKWRWSVGVAAVMVALSMAALVYLPGSQASGGSPDLVHHGGVHSSSGPIPVTGPNAQADGSFGTSVATSGSFLVIGAPDETVSGDVDAGHVYVFKGPTWTSMATLTSPNPQADAYFGASVALVGTTVMVGAPGDTASGYAAAGHVYLFKATSGELLATLTSPNAQTNGYFGRSVATGGFTIVVGAWGETVSGFTSAGHVYTFRSPSGELIRTLASPNPETYGSFGYSVACGRGIVVGALGETVSGHAHAGRAYVFNPATGAQMATLTSPNAQINGYFGVSVSISATRIAVGAYLETASSYAGAGAAYVFDALTWVLSATLTSPFPQSGGSFGQSVAISGTTVLVGAYNEAASGYAGSGRAYVFKDTSPVGALLATLTSPNAQTSGEFGWAVSIFGTRVAVGAPGETVSGQVGAGNGYAFSTRAFRPILTTPNPQAEGSFGSSVAIGANVAAIGASGESASGYDGAGHAYVDYWASSILVSTLTSPNAQADGGFGYSVAVSGSIVVVGAPYETVSGHLGAGHAYVYRLMTGALIATLTSPNAQAGGDFGFSVAICGSTVVVGAYGETPAGSSSAGAGDVYLFEDTAPTGTLMATFTSPNAQPDGAFGYSVAISGTEIAIGAPGESAMGYSNAGQAYVYKTTTDALTTTLLSPNPETGGSFGTAVAISGATVAVGAPSETAAGYAAAGHAYVYRVLGGVLILALTSPNAQAAGVFGAAIALRGTTVVVGGPGETVGGCADAGHAYVYKATTGTLLLTLTSQYVQADGFFGGSVTTSPSISVIGASGEAPPEQPSAGLAEVFQV